jgi:hypothetical protein
LPAPKNIANSAKPNVTAVPSLFFKADLLNLNKCIKDPRRGYQADLPT